MNLSRDEAGAQLAAIDDVVQRLKQSRIYRVSGDIAILWGVLQFAQYVAYNASPGLFARAWIAIDAVGVVATLFMLRSAIGPLSKPGRVLAAYALFYGFGFLWSGPIGHLGGRELAVFWHTLFLFGYSLAGVWFGIGFLLIGLGLTAAILAAYYFAGALFWPLMTLITGCGYILCGYWMRRA